MKRAHGGHGSRARVTVAAAVVAVLLFAAQSALALASPALASPAPASPALASPAAADSPSSSVTASLSDHVNAPLTPRITARTSLAPFRIGLRRTWNPARRNVDTLDRAGRVAGCVVPRQFFLQTSCSSTLHAIATGRISFSATTLPPPAH
jgi:hypothetical protein